jgi:hypothetical protein
MKVEEYSYIYLESENAGLLAGKIILLWINNEHRVASIFYRLCLPASHDGISALLPPSCTLKCPEGLKTITIRPWYARAAAIQPNLHASFCERTTLSVGLETEVLAIGSWKFHVD